MPRLHDVQLGSDRTLGTIDSSSSPNSLLTPREKVIFEECKKETELWKTKAERLEKERHFFNNRNSVYGGQSLGFLGFQTDTSDELSVSDSSNLTSSDSGFSEFELFSCPDLDQMQSQNEPQSKKEEQSLDQLPSKLFSFSNSNHSEGQETTGLAKSWLVWSIASRFLSLSQQFFAPKIKSKTDRALGQSNQSASPVINVYNHQLIKETHAQFTKLNDQMRLFIYCLDLIRSQVISELVETPMKEIASNSSMNTPIIKMLKINNKAVAIEKGSPWSHHQSSKYKALQSSHRKFHQKKSLHKFSLDSRNPSPLRRCLAWKSRKKKMRCCSKRIFDEFDWDPGAAPQGVSRHASSSFPVSSTSPSSFQNKSCLRHQRGRNVTTGFSRNL